MEIAKAKAGPSLRLPHERRTVHGAPNRSVQDDNIRASRRDRSLFGRYFTGFWRCVLLLRYDGSGVAGADCAGARGKGRVQAACPRARAGRRARAALATRATGADDGARRTDEA